MRRVRSWDKAATKPSAATPNPDWTVGTLVAQLSNGTYVIEDVLRFRDGPAEVLARIKHTAETDGRNVIVMVPQDPGQAGLVDVETTQRELSGYPVKSWRVSRDKRAYAQVWAPLAKREQVAVVRADYLPALFQELEAFPMGAKDDQVDSISGAFQELTGPAFTVDYLSGSSLSSQHSDPWNYANPSGFTKQSFAKWGGL